MAYIPFLHNAYFTAKVGIGTASPTQTLHVGDNSIDAVIRTTYTDGSYVDIHGYGIVMSRTASYIKPLNDGTQALYLGDANAGSTWDSVQINAETNVWKKDATEFMRLNSSGNLGIGTASPAAGLQVALGSTTIPAAGASTASAVFGNSTSDDNYGVAIGANSSGVGYISSQRTDGTATTYNLAIQSNGGFVGIGTATPGTKLHVGSGSGATVDTGYQVVIDSAGIAGLQILSATTQSGRIVFGDSGDNDIGMIKYDHTDNSMGFRTNGSGNERMRITSAGDVGIGATPTTGYKLDVVKTSPGYSIVGSHVSGGKVGIYSSTGDNGIGTINNYNFNLFTNNSAPQVTLTTAGNVGIGTTSPTAAKLVVDSNTAPQILVKNSGGGDAKILFEDNTGGTQNASITFDQSSQNTLTIATGYQSPTDLNRINISPAGNVGLTVRGGTGGSGLGQPLVGIGTTSPTEKLEVVGNIKITAALLSNQENTDVDTGTETVANVAIATYTAAFFDFVVKKTTNVRSGTVYACHDGTNVEFTETSTNDLGDTSDVTLSVDISGTNMRLLATVTSDDWSVKSLIRAI